MKWSDFKQGERFGDWVIISKSKSRHGQRYYKCNCVCGTVAEVRASCLGKASNKCRSCTVLESTKRLIKISESRRNGNPSRIPKTFEFYRSQLWGNIQKRTINSGKKCTDKYYEKKNRLLLMSKDAFYSWLELQRPLIENIYSNGKIPSIDRINNNGNYSIDNIQILELIENIKKGKK
jgi:hypothetical protein